MRQDYQQTIDQDLEIRVEIARQAAAIGIDAVKEWLRLYKKAQEQGLNSRISIATHEVERWLFSHAPPNPKERSPKRLLLSFIKAMITRIRSL
jgi:hypothetical protein